MVERYQSIFIHQPFLRVDKQLFPDTFRFWVLRASKRTVPECLKNLHVTFRTLSVLIVLRHPAPLEVRKARSRYARTRPVCKPSKAFNSRIGGCAGPPGARSQKSRNWLRWLRVAVAGAARHEGSNPRCHIHLGTPVRAGKVSGCAACRPYRLIQFSRGQDVYPVCHLSRWKSAHRSVS